MCAHTNNIPDLFLQKVQQSIYLAEHFILYRILKEILKQSFKIFTITHYLLI